MRSDFHETLSPNLVKGIDFNRIMVKVSQVQGTPPVYYIALLEFSQQNTLKTLMKTSKT